MRTWLRGDERGMRNALQKIYLTQFVTYGPVSPSVKYSYQANVSCRRVAEASEGVAEPIKRHFSYFQNFPIYGLTSQLRG